MLINKEPDTMLSQFTPCFSSLSNDTTLKMSSLSFDIGRHFNLNTANYA